MKTKCSKNNYNNNNIVIRDLQQQLQTSAQQLQIQNEQQMEQQQHREHDLKLLAAEPETQALAETNTTVMENNQNLCFTRWWFMLMQQTINYNYNNNYNNILQRANAATASNLPTAFLNELLGNVTNILPNEQ